MILTSCYQKNSPTPPTECGWLMVMGEAQKLLVLPPPPLTICPGYGDPEKSLLLLPPPLNLPGLRRSRIISATTPPLPPNVPGLRRSRKIYATTPPPTKSARVTAIPENFCYYPPPSESGRPPEITENWPPPIKNSWLRLVRYWKITRIYRVLPV